MEEVEGELAHSDVPVARVWSIELDAMLAMLDIDKRVRTDSDTRTDVICLGGFDAIRGLEFDTLIVTELPVEFLAQPYF